MGLRGLRGLRGLKGLRGVGKRRRGSGPCGGSRRELGQWLLPEILLLGKKCGWHEREQEPGGFAVDMPVKENA